MGFTRVYFRKGREMHCDYLMRRFFRAREGSIAINFGLTFAMVVGATVGAIEIEQMRKARSIMQDRLDATLLYLGNTDYKTTPQDAGAAYFRKTIEKTDLKVKTMTPTFVYDPASGEITGDVDFTLQGLLSGGVVADMPLDVHAVVAPKTKGKVEIAMVLDVSGSMGWTFDSNSNGAVGKRRIDGLFEAADAMFDVIYTNPLAVPAVAVIPYATSVDITDLFAARSTSEKTTEYEAMNATSLNQAGMAYGAPSLLNLTSNDVKERDHANTAAVYPAERYTSQNADGSYQLSLDAPSPTKRIPVYTERFSELWTDWRGEKFKVTAYGWQYYYGGTERPYMGLMPMTQNMQDVRDYVASFDPSGGTAGHIGAAWGLYALTPEWNTTFQHPAGQPMGFDETTEKYLVIMTDGQFNSQKDPNMSAADMYDYFQSVCTTARDKGIRVFTVGLLLDTTTETELKECAGATGAFFPVDDRLELVNAFRAIGRETGELRLIN